MESRVRHGLGSEERAGCLKELGDPRPGAIPQPPQAFFSFSKVGVRYQCCRFVRFHIMYIKHLGQCQEQRWR